MIKNIGIIGVGGVGGYFGGKLCQILDSNINYNIYFIARGQHLTEIQKNGLILNTIDEGKFICKPTLATDNISELPELDLCILCVKVFDLEDVLKKLSGKIKSNTIILPLLNGIDIYSRIKNVLSTGIVLPACVFIGTHIEKAGVVTQAGGACKILFGQDPNIPCNNIDELSLLFDNAKIKYKYSDDVTSEIWKKFIFIASFGLVTACFSKTIGEVISSEKLSAYVLDIMKEIHNLSQILKINLPNNIIEMSFNNGKSFPFDTKTSLQRDFERLDKPDERDLFSGTIIRLCKSKSIDCNATELIYSKMNEMKK